MKLRVSAHGAIGSVLLLVLLSAQTPPTAWPLEPKDFKGVAFGSTERAAREIRHIGRGMCQSFGAERVCFDRDSAPFPGVTYKFVKDAMVQVYAKFPSEQYASLRDIFIEKYGRPQRSETEKVRTKAGVEYENEVLTWTGNVITLRLCRFGSTIDEGSATYSNLNWLDEQVKAEEAAKKKAAASF